MVWYKSGITLSPEQAMKNITILINQNEKGHWEWELRQTSNLRIGPLDYSRESCWTFEDACAEAKARAEWRAARTEAEVELGDVDFPAFEDWAAQRKR